jgi:hypothetical protein
MKLVLGLIFLLSSYSLYAKRFANIHITAPVIQNASFNRLQQIRFEYVKFLIRAEADGKYHLDKSDKNVYLDKLIQKIFIENAAADYAGDLCFFGGWPSKKSGQTCKSPWKTKDQKDVISYGGYKSDSACGNVNEFRCNPVLFGSPTQNDLRTGSPINNVKVNLSPNKNGNKPGYCVETNGTFKQLTQKCEMVSRDSINNLMDQYRENPSELEKFSKGIDRFCNTMPDYDACDALNKRLKTLHGDVYEPTTGEEKKMRAPAVKKYEIDYGDQIIKRCQTISKQQDNDVYNRKVLSLMTEENPRCKVPEISGFDQQEDFDALANMVNRQDLFNKANIKAFKTAALAVLVHERRFIPRSKYNFKNENSAWKTLIKEVPKLNNNGYKKAFGEVLRQVNTLNLKQVNFSQAADNYNQNSEKVNKLCRKLRTNYAKQFGRQNWFQDLINTQGEEAFMEVHTKDVKKSLETFYKNTTIGHFNISKHFKKNFHDYSASFVENCAENDSYDVFDYPVLVSDIDKGARQIQEKLAENLERIEDKQIVASSNDIGDIEDEFREYLKNDAQTISELLKSANNPIEKKRYAAFICSEVLDLYKSDRNWQVADYVIGGAGFAASIVLAFTGVGGPAAIALGAVSLSTMGYSGTRAYQVYDDAADIKKVTNVNFASGKQAPKDYIKNKDTEKKLKEMGYRNVVFSVAGLAGAGNGVILIPKFAGLTKSVVNLIKYGSKLPEWILYTQYVFNTRVMIKRSEKMVDLILDPTKQNIFKYQSFKYYVQELKKQGQTKSDIAEGANSAYILINEIQKLQAKLDVLNPIAGVELETIEAKQLALKIENYESVLKSIVDKLGGYAAMKQFYPLLEKGEFKAQLDSV